MSATFDAPVRVAAVAGPVDRARISRIAWGLLTAATIGFLVIVATRVAAPVMSSDEYAYFISGKYFDRLPAVFALEPGVPRLSTVVFFSLIHTLFGITDSGFVMLLRLVHLAEWVATSYVLFKALANEGDRDALLKGSALMLLLPNSMYLFLVMPEADLVLLTACIGYAALVLIPRRPAAGTLVAGLLSGVAMLVKPHALATFLTVAGFIALLPFVRRPLFGIRRAAFLTVLYTVVSFATAAVLFRLYQDAWQLDPRILLGFNFYGQIIQASSPGAFAAKVAAAAGYFGAHLALISVAFAPSVVFLAREVRRGVRGNLAASDEERSGRAAVFITLLVIAHVAMTAWFTASAAQFNSIPEAMRLHGRYLTPALVFLAFIVVRSVHRFGRRGLLIAACYSLAAIGVSVFWVLPYFKIYPWDYPLAFAFFSVPNHYLFDFTENYGFLKVPLLCGLVGLGVVAAVHRPAARRCLIAMTLLVAIVGNLQAYRWMFERSRGLEPLAQSVRAIATLTGAEQFGKGLLIADSDFGEVPTVLFNLGNAPRLVVRPPGSPISLADVKDADWVLLAGNLKVDYPFLQSATFGPFRFLPAGSDVEFKSGPRPLIRTGETANVALAAGKYPAPFLQGFSVAEPWGRWTGENRASVELPVTIQGRVTIRLWAWTLPENRGKPLVVRMGSASATIDLPLSPAEETVTLLVESPCTRLEFESPVHRPAGADRTIGIALATIRVEAH